MTGSGSRITRICSAASQRQPFRIFIIRLPIAELRWSFSTAWRARVRRCGLGAEIGDARRNLGKLCARQRYVGIEISEMRRWIDNAELDISSTGSRVVIGKQSHSQIGRCEGGLNKKNRIRAASIQGD